MGVSACNFALSSSNDLLLSNGVTGTGILINSNTLSLTQGTSLMNLSNSSINITSSNAIYVANSNSYMNLSQSLILSSAFDTAVVASNNVSISSGNKFQMQAASNMTLSSSNIYLSSTNLYGNFPGEISLVKQSYGGLGINNSGVNLAGSNVVLSSGCNGLSANGNILKLYGTSDQLITFSSNNVFVSSSSNIIMSGDILDLSDFSNVLLPAGYTLTGGSNPYIDANWSPLFIKSSNVLIPTQIQLGTSNCYWKEYIDRDGSSNNLTFQSSGGTMVTFVDGFCAEVLNFTGKHRCTPSVDCQVLQQKQKDDTTLKDLLGLIVIADGTFCDLDNNDYVHIDEALPKIQIARKCRDQRAFGVVGGYDKEGKFKLGNMLFKHKNALKIYCTICWRRRNMGM